MLNKSHSEFIAITNSYNLELNKLAKHIQKLESFYYCE